jgi:methylamine--corrinoid protein Co-methyltransferase
MVNASFARILDVIDRSENGPVCDEKEFDLKYVATGIQEVIKKYDIKLDPDYIVNQDDDLADRIWQAAKEFFANCGVLCTSTSRRITYTPKEIEELVKLAPSKSIIGEGNDARVQRHREVEDSRPPLVVGGPIGTNLPEDQYIKIMLSYMQEPVIDTTTPGTPTTIYGRKPRTGAPIEVMGAGLEVNYVFEAARRAGRPGMPIGGIQMAQSAFGYISGISRNGLRPCDWQNMALVSEMKTNYDSLNKLAHTITQGGIIHGFYNPIYGGLCGGSEGVAVITAAGLMAMQVVYGCVQHSNAPPHPYYFSSTAPEILRAQSAAVQAISRNSSLITYIMTSPKGGPGTDTLLYECIATAANATVSGASALLGVRSAVGIKPGHCTGLEARFNGEVGHATTRLSRVEADAIVKKAISKYQDLLDKEPYGKPFSEVYDVETVQPKQEWLDIYESVKAEATNWGMTFELAKPFPSV